MPPSTRPYPIVRAAGVLLSGTPSIRFIVPAIGWNLTDNAYVGPGPEGLFYYDDNIFDNVVRDPTIAKFRLEQFYDSGNRYLRIFFFKPGSTTDYFGEFVAYDPHDRASGSGIIGQTREATWKRQNYISMPMAINKPASSQQILISGQFSAEISTGNDLLGYSINQVGAILTTRNLTNPGNFVRWYKDGAIFVDSTTGEISSFLRPIDERNVISPKDDLGWSVNWKL